MKEDNKQQLVELIADKFNDYARYIIQDRALPDVRDGLKPVQRRILFAMYQLHLFADRNFKKSVRIIGEVIGKYHPHGDSSVYDALIRLSQTWKMNHPLIEVQGNNGSIDNDPPAAMRYTEARLTAVSNLLFQNISADLVPYLNNFDDTEQEPLVLPSLIPNLLLNGSSGIAAGYSTNIPPHNLQELVQAVIYRLQHPSCSVTEIMHYCLGPDFPTGGIVSDKANIKTLYETGKGKLLLTSKMVVSKQKIIVSEIPYEVHKQNIIKQIEQLVIDHPEYGLEGVVDESDRHRLQIVIHLAKTTNSTNAWQQLLKATDLETNYYANMVVIHNDRPQQLGLLALLDAYLAYQVQLQQQQLLLEENKIKARLEIIDGLIKIAFGIDQLLELIRKADHKQDAINKLQVVFELNKRQAEAIVNLRLYRLTSSDVNAILQEQSELNQQLANIAHLLADKTAFNNYLKEKLQACANKFAHKRRSLLQKEVLKTEPLEQSTLIIPQICYFSITNRGYCFMQKEPVSYQNILVNDYLVFDQKATTDQYVAIVTKQGFYLLLSLNSFEFVNKMVHLSNYMSWNDNDTILFAYRFRMHKKYQQQLCFISASNYGKKIALELLHSLKPQVLHKIHLDNCLTAFIIDEQSQIFCASAIGKGVIYDAQSIALTKLNARGVKLLNLKAEEQIWHASIYEANFQQYYYAQNKWRAFKLDDTFICNRPARGKNIINNVKVPLENVLNLPINSVVQYDIQTKGIYIGNLNEEFFQEKKATVPLIEPLHNYFLN